MQNKITENIVANLLCFLIDNYECQPLSEEKLQEIGQEFMQSDYNKSEDLDGEIKARIEKWNKFHQFSYKEGREIIDILSEQVEALDNENKMLKFKSESLQEQLEEV